MFNSEVMSILSTAYVHVTGHLGQLSLSSLLGSEASTACLAGVKAGCVYLCQMAGNTV